MISRPMLLGLLSLATASLAAQEPLRQSLEVHIPAPPSPVRRAGQVWLLYELHATNFAQVPLAMERLSVLDADTGATLETLDPAALRNARRQVSTPATPDDGQLPPGMRAVVYLELAFARQAPARLAHRLEFRAAGQRGSIQTRPLPVVRTTAAALGPPLAGGPWVAVYDPALDRGHRRSLYAVDGTARIPGRYAIDWFKVNDAGLLHAGERKVLTQWFGYGAEVLAVGDGVIASARDGRPDRDFGPRPPGDDLADGSGNYVSLRLSDGRHVFYEHLKPGSLRVKVGARVRRGQVLAALGNSGDTSGPHLHFHVADADALLAAEGVPFTIERFTLLGHYPSLQQVFAGTRWRAAPAPVVVAGEQPAANSVLQFPAQGR